MMKYPVVFALVAAIQVFSKGTCAANHGYSLGFQGHSIATFKNGFIDFETLGWEDVDQDFTISFWARYYYTLGYVFHFTGESTAFESLVHFAPLWGESPGFVFGGQMADSVQPIDLWTQFRHVVVTVDSQFGTTLYVDGVAVSTLQGTGQSLRREGERVSFNIGAIRRTVEGKYVIGPRNTYQGSVDEFGLWSRVLSKEEIDSLREKPMDVSAMTFGEQSAPAYTDESYGIARSLVVYYDFEVNCADLAQGLNGATCSITGDGIVKNHGASGEAYDLYLGKVTDEPEGNMYQARSTEGESYSRQFDIPMPAKSVESLLSVDTVSAPSVYYAVPGKDLEVNFGEFESFRITTEPQMGGLESETGDPLSTGQEYQSSMLIYTSARDSFTEPDVFVVSLGNGISHQVHIWPYQKPILEHQPAFDNFVVLEADSYVWSYPNRAIAIARPPGLLTYDRDSVSFSSPEPELLYFLYYPNWWQVRTGNDTMFPALVLISQLGFSGDEVADMSFAVRPYEIGQGADTDFLISDQLGGKVTVKENNNPPSVTPAEGNIEEESKGLKIKLNSTVYVENKSGGVVISQLPSKGELYGVVDKAGTLEKIDAPYQVFNLRDVFDQYAYKVLNVSSWFGKPPAATYHPMGILGRPHCAGSGGECIIDQRFPNLEVEDLVRCDRYFQDDSKDGLFVMCRITEVNQDEFPVLFSAQVLPMQYRAQPTDEGFTKCFPQGDGFPADCSTEEFVALGGTLELTGLPIAAFREYIHGVFAPANENYLPEEDVKGGDLTAAYGDEYYFDTYNQRENYEEGDPPFTEFIEVLFKEPVYPVGIQIGSSLGGGAVVRLQFMTPDGEWETIYQGQALLEEHLATTADNIYHRFDKNICRVLYKVDRLRVELDTSMESGIPGFNLLDYVKLSGSHFKQPAALSYPFNEVFYVPNKDAAGVDQFLYFSTDCPGDRLRDGQVRAATISIANIEDKPRCGTVPSEEELVVAPLQSIDFRVDAIEVDPGQSVLLMIKYNQGLVGGSEGRSNNETNTSGSFELLENGQVVGIVPVDTLIPTREVEPYKQSAMVRFTAPICTSAANLKFTFTLIAQSVENDSSGSKDVSVTIDCGGLEVKNVFDGISSNSAMAGFVLGGIGILLAVVAAAFNLYYRHVKIVRVTSPKVNVVICLGIAMVYSYLIAASVGVSDVGTCQVESFLTDGLPGVRSYVCPEALEEWAEAEANSTVSQIAECCRTLVITECISPALLLSLGLLLAFAMLIGKTERIIILMIPKDLRRTKITDQMVLANGMMIFTPLALLMLIWYFVDPIYIKFDRLAPLVDVASQRIISRYDAQCSSPTYVTFTTIVIGYLVLVVGYGFFQAWKVRGVYIKQANDSKSIAVSVYNIFVLGAIGLVLNYTVDEGEPKHLITLCITWLCCTVTLLALFGQRAYEVISGETRLTDERAVTDHLLNAPSVHGTSYFSQKYTPTSHASLDAKAVLAPYTDKVSTNPLRRREVV